MVTLWRPMDMRWEERSATWRRNFRGGFRFFEVLVKDVDLLAKVSGPMRPENAPDLPEKDRAVSAAAIGNQCKILLTGDDTHARIESRRKRGSVVIAVI